MTEYELFGSESDNDDQEPKSKKSYTLSDRVIKQGMLIFGVFIVIY